MGDDLRGCLSAGLKAAVQWARAASRGEEACGKKVACAGRVDHFLDRSGRNLDTVAALDGEGARR